MVIKLTLKGLDMMLKHCFNVHVHAKSFVSPVLAALGDPLPHSRVEGLSAHERVLTVRVEQMSQSSQPVLLWTLGRHGLQVLYDGGGQHLSWRQERSRSQWFTAHTNILICVFEFNTSLCTCVGGVTRAIHDVKEFMFRESTWVLRVLKHIPRPTSGRLPH